MEGVPFPLRMVPLFIVQEYMLPGVVFTEYVPLLNWQFVALPEMTGVGINPSETLCVAVAVHPVFEVTVTVTVPVPELPHVIFAVLLVVDPLMTPPFTVHEYVTLL